MDAFMKDVVNVKPVLLKQNSLEMDAFQQRLFNSQRETYFLLKPDAPKTNAFHVKDVVNIEPFFFPTCQVRVVRFYVSCLLLSSSPLLLLLLNRDPRRTVFSVGPQPRPSTPSVPCRTSTTTIPAQCSLPDLNHDHPRPVFPAGPQPRVSTPSVPCRTSCRKKWDKECAEES